MAESKEGRHIYGVIETNEEKHFGPIGIGDRGDGVYTIGHRDVAAVVSSSPIIDYGSLTKDAVVRPLFAHQAVLEHVMKAHSIIPAKFPTVVEGTEEVQEILEKGHEVFKNALRSMNGKIELDVAASWDKVAVLKDIYNENEEIRRLQEKIGTEWTPQAQADKVTLGKMVRSTLLERREQYGGEITEVLRAYAQDLCPHDLLDDMMLINIAFLMDKHQEEAFDRKVNELDQKYQQKINFRCIGPLPPYSFSTIEIRKLHFEEVDEARRSLGLAQQATMSEIREAYRKLAHKFHPDKHPDDPEAQKKFKKITDAYRLLQDYCQAGRCAFKETDVERGILIRVLKSAQSSSTKRNSMM